MPRLLRPVDCRAWLPPSEKKPLPESIGQRSKFLTVPSYRRATRQNRKRITATEDAYLISFSTSASTASIALSFRSPFAKAWLAITLLSLAMITVTSAAGLMP